MGHKVTGSVSMMGRGQAQPSLRSINRLHIMEALRAVGPASRVEIGERTGLAPATVSEITAALLAEGLLRESRSVVAGRGRPRILLEINADGGRVLGVKLSTYRVTLSLTDLVGQLIDATSLPLLPNGKLDRPTLSQAQKRPTRVLGPDDHREAVVLQLYNGYSYDEIGTMMNVPVTTVRNWVVRAKSKLRATLAPYFDNDDLKPL